MISIYTLTLGRELYLTRLLESLALLGGWEGEYEHYICAQGVKLSNEFKELLETKYCHVKLVEWEENYGIAEGMNKILPQLKGDIIIKMDEDCILRSPNFFTHVTELHELIPTMVFSPFPVGLINNLGGPSSSQRGVIHGEKTDTYYTLRAVNHIGGFCRISPAKPTKEWVFDYDKSDEQSGSEDGQHSQKCMAQKLPMAYLENALIVEHQESTLGQHARYGKDYFGKRF
jgi:glycosyltransferase involved in cell wall biosynthesis